jgi:hypothetical protein
MIDAGWKCSVPSCGVTAPLEIDHIEEFATVQAHDYGNLIVLCRNHHGMKVSGSNPRQVNAHALKLLKQQQVELSGRYGDIERRVLEFFVRDAAQSVVHLPGDFDIMLMHLLDAGLLEKDFNASGSIVMKIGPGDEPTPENSITTRQAYRLTEAGKEAIDTLRAVRRAVDEEVA